MKGHRRGEKEIKEKALKLGFLRGGGGEKRRREIGYIRQAGKKSNFTRKEI